MRWITWSLVGSLVRGLAGLSVGTLVGVACTEDSTETEPRPSDDELLAFYTDFCLDWQDCQPDAVESVAGCAKFQVEGYGKLPTACLNRLLDYHRCAMDLDCEAYNDPNDRSCSPEESVIHDVDCGGMAAP
jgi:hypothetical protein